VGIAEIEGVDVDEIENGSVNVTLPEGKQGERRSIPAAGAVVALAAAGLAASLVGRRKR
jgi:hypothetical protein